MMQYAKEVLENRYFSLKEKYDKALEDMVECPNEESQRFLGYAEQKLKDLKDALRALGKEL